MSADLIGKRLELLRQLLPQLARVAVLWYGANPYPALVFKETQTAGRATGIEVQSLEVRNTDELDGIFESSKRQRPEALILVEDPFIFAHLKRIANFALSQKLPSLFGFREFPIAGGFMSYGASLADAYQHAADYVDKILRGAKPADIPVQQPTKFDLVINLNTAKALGIIVPRTFLVAADEVIE
jgi:putative tryptophan/tyrosine transport system substrate-binding protein